MPKYPLRAMRRVLVTVLGSLVLCAPAHAALPSGFVGLYGDDSFFGDSPYRLGQMGMQARLGVQTVRQPFEWWRVELRPGHFDWSAYDGYVADAARARLSILPILMAPPSFRSSRPATSHSRAMFPPRRNADFGKFAAAAVKRYGREGSFWRARPRLPYVPITAWQVWNEPNIPNFWRSGPDAAGYVELLRVGSDAIRKADPDAEVVAAGLPNSRLGVPYLEYLQTMYDAGARGMFDTLAIHPYASSAAGVITLAEHAREVMNENRDARARLWVTEFGWSTGGDASAFRVSRRGQADRIALAVSGLVAERRALRLRGFILFKWKDSTAPGRSDPWPLHTGLLGADGRAKPGFWTFGRLVRSLESSVPASPGSAALTRISRRNVRLSPLGNAAIALGCASPATDACQGSLRLRTAEPISCRGMEAPAGSDLGAARFRIAVAPALAPVQLNPESLALARCAGSVRVRASVAKRSTAKGAAVEPVEFVLRAR
jgi:polysaccharide biosynthesis protein PslG